MFTVEFMAHNSHEWQRAHVQEQRAVYELVCALNFTGFSYRVSACGIDLTEGFEQQLAADATLRTLPVVRTAGGIPA